MVPSSTSDCHAGLDLESDTIIEVACIITDGELERMIEACPTILHLPSYLLYLRCHLHNLAAVSQHIQHLPRR